MKPRTHRKMTKANKPRIAMLALAGFVALAVYAQKNHTASYLTESEMEAIAKSPPADPEGFNPEATAEAVARFKQVRRTTAEKNRKAFHSLFARK